MTTAPISKKTESLKRDLFSNDASVVMKALIKCREQGTPQVVEPLIALYSSSTDDAVKEEISDMLCNLKVSGLATVFVNALTNNEYLKVRKDILAFMWNSAIQPVDGMVEITDVAIEGTFEETLECFTLLESMEDEIPEDILTESIYRVREHLGKSEGTREQRALLNEYLNALEARQQN